MLGLGQNQFHHLNGCLHLLRISSLQKFRFIVRIREPSYIPIIHYIRATYLQPQVCMTLGYGTPIQHSFLSIPQIFPSK